MKNKVIIFIISFFIGTIPVLANKKEEVTFVKCIDGDTAVFKTDKEIKVRFLAIDTPETVHPTKKDETYGKEASTYTCNKISSAKNITLEYDDKSDLTDKYQRILAWVWVDDSLLQKELISLGYAKVYYIYGKYSYLDELYKVEDDAKQKYLGIWNNPITYTITFNELDNKKEEIYKVNDQIKEYIPTKKGYIFKYWKYKNKEFDFNTRITSNMTLTAVYEKNNNYLYLLLITLISILTLIIRRVIKKTN